MAKMQIEHLDVHLKDCMSNAVCGIQPAFVTNRDVFNDLRQMTEVRLWQVTKMDTGTGHDKCGDRKQVSSDFCT